MKGINLKNHFALISSYEVEQICAPILKPIGITYFNYIKIYKDGSRELLTNNAAWIGHFYSNALFETTAIVDIEYLLPKGYFLWSELKNDDKAYVQGRELFNIDNGISFVVKKKEATLLYIFASTANNYSINNFYIRNIDLLKRFILYFCDKSSFLLKKIAENRIILPHKQIINNDRLNTVNITKQERERFLRNTQIDRFFIMNLDEDIYLTKREAECVFLMLDGQTAKQIAEYLNISYRTVETHYKNAKDKLNCSTKEELNKILKDSNIRDVVLAKINKLSPMS